MQQLARLVDVDGNGRINIWQFVAAFVADERATGTVAGQNLGRQLSHGVVQVRRMCCFVLSSRLGRLTRWRDAVGGRRDHLFA